jgi:hypothetical protein
MATATNLTPYATDEWFEYWLHEGQIYRNAKGNRGPAAADTPTMPMGVRWECSLEHFRRYLAGRCQDGRQ